MFFIYFCKQKIKMARYLKKGKTEAQRKQDAEQIRETVGRIIREIEEQGDLKVKEYSLQFDK